MKQMVSREKMSKRDRKAMDAAKRIQWGFAPDTRRIESKKTYNRKKGSWRTEDHDPFFIRLRNC